jgi:hypothetical protein
LTYCPFCLNRKYRDYAPRQENNSLRCTALPIRATMRCKRRAARNSTGNVQAEPKHRLLVDRRDVVRGIAEPLARRRERPREGCSATEEFERFFTLFALRIHLSAQRVRRHFQWHGCAKKLLGSLGFHSYIARSPHQWREQEFTALSGFFCRFDLSFAAALFVRKCQPLINLCGRDAGRCR